MRKQFKCVVWFPLNNYTHEWDFWQISSEWVSEWRLKHTNSFTAAQPGPVPCGRPVFSEISGFDQILTKKRPQTPHYIIMNHEYELRLSLLVVTFWADLSLKRRVSVSFTNWLHSVDLCPASVCPARPQLQEMSQERVQQSHSIRS